MKYDIIDVSEEGFYCVREIPTDKIILASERESTVKQYADLFNKGCGFNGWTPEFFVENDIIV